MTPLVAISNDFLEAYAQIPRQQQKKVRAFMKKFKADPKSSAINYEKIHDVKDDRVRTVRIDQKYRAVVLHPADGSVYVLVWVDNHDEAMDWAKDRTFAVNPATGALQMFNVSEVAKVVEDKPRSKSKSGLLAEHDDATLLSFGLPELLLPAVRAISTLSDLDKLSKLLPDEAAEALHWLGEGIPPEEVREAFSASAAASVDTNDLAAALQHPDSKRRFVTIQSDAELTAILDAPLEKWRVFLHPSQERLVGKQYNGPVRVIGGPGTGKTVVAMHRARHLVRTLCEKDSDRILFTTFTANLAQNVDENLRHLCANEYSKIECIHLHSWAVRLLRDRFNKNIAVVSQSEIDKFWEDAIFSAEEFEFEPGFLRQEWESVVQANEITELAEYLKVSRRGRGKTISRPERGRVWKVFMRFRDALERSEKTEWTTVIREARKHLEASSLSLPYKAVIVDEAQDFQPDEWKLIRSIIPEGKNDLFIVGDAHQRIYGSPVILSQCGINIRGRSSRLHINYRTTEQIRRWAMGMLQGLAFDDLDGGIVDEKGYRSLLAGPPPQVYAFDSSEDEATFIGEQVNGILETRKPTDICIVARTNKLLQEVYRPVLRSLNIKHTVLDKDNQPHGIALATMHRVKGLEFPVMILAGINENIVPLKVKGIASDPAALKEHLNRERSLLFVAATRARDVLIITSSGSPSRFVQAIPRD
jgi:superfamily I DNA/RNA helicase